LLVGAGTNPVASYSGLTWITETNTLNATNISINGDLVKNGSGNVGIGTIPSGTSGEKLHIVNSSTATNSGSGIIGLFVENPTNTAGHNSVISSRIGGSTAGKVIYSFDVSGVWGCSLTINGNDNTNKRLMFNSQWDGNGTDVWSLNIVMVM
jgi:hypothetical protein